MGEIYRAFSTANSCHKNMPLNGASSSQSMTDFEAVIRTTWFFWGLFEGLAAEAMEEILHVFTLTRVSKEKPNTKPILKI